MADNLGKQSCPDTATKTSSEKVRGIIYILIREGKPLYPFLSKLRGRRSVRFGIVKVYVEKECRKIKFMYNIQGVPKKRDKSIAPLFIGRF
jgi:hypothetical protein